MGVTLFGWGPMFGVAGPSPFVIKTDIQLQMLGVEFNRAIADLDSVPKRKAPYVRDDGVLVEDSTHIRWHFETRLGRSLDQHLSPEQRATAWAVERMLEDHLSPILACERWLEADNFDRGPRGFFAGVPEPVQQQVIEGVLRDLRSSMTGQGVLRHSREERMNRARADVAAVATLLGDKPFLMGTAPSGVDATVFGIVSACTAPVFDTPLIGIVREHTNLSAFLERMEARYIHPDLWPRD